MPNLHTADARASDGPGRGLTARVSADDLLGVAEPQRMLFLQRGGAQAAAGE
ncbi:hypothetical protein [Streptomyces vinaceus]|uniref:hypothetical protein n=1 Tax=Streptomyces vinaceus TaxID=1960 RepID=UPI003814141C